MSEEIKIRTTKIFDHEREQEENENQPCRPYCACLCSPSLPPLPSEHCCLLPPHPQTYGQRNSKSYPKSLAGDKWQLPTGIFHTYSWNGYIRFRTCYEEGLPPLPQGALPPKLLLHSLRTSSPGYNIKYFAIYISSHDGSMSARIWDHWYFHLSRTGNCLGESPDLPLCVVISSPSCGGFCFCWELDLSSNLWENNQLSVSLMISTFFVTVIPPTFFTSRLPSCNTGFQKVNCIIRYSS